MKTLITENKFNKLMKEQLCSSPFYDSHEQWRGHNDNFWHARKYQCEGFILESNIKDFQDREFFIIK